MTSRSSPTFLPNDRIQHVHHVDVAGTDAGAALLTEISSNGGNVQFNYRAGSATTRGSLFSRDSVITYDPAHRPIISTTAGPKAAQPKYVLSHELHHAWKNSLSCWLGCSRPLVLPGSVPRGQNPWEAHAVRYTNRIRAQAGAGYQRTHYDGFAVP